MAVKIIPTNYFPYCPNCGAKMHLLRKQVGSSYSVYSANWREWWGCTNYPKCKGALSQSQAKHLLKARINREKKREILQERRKQSVEAIRANLSKKSHINYYQYINSPEWRQKAEAAKRRARYRCQLCNKSSWETVLNTHHRTYERLGYEMEEDLIVLCDDCHKTFHKNGKLSEYKA